MGQWSNPTYLGRWTANGGIITRFYSVAGYNSDFFLCGNGRRTCLLILSQGYEIPRGKNSGSCDSCRSQRVMVFSRECHEVQHLLENRRGPLLTPIITTRRLLLHLRYLGDFDCDVYLEIKRHKIFRLKSRTKSHYGQILQEFSPCICVI